MAAPIAAGHVALIRQYYREGWYPAGRDPLVPLSTPSPSPSSSQSSSTGFSPSAALLKATYLHGARLLRGARDLGCCRDARSAHPDPATAYGRCCCADPACVTQVRACVCVTVVQREASQIAGRKHSRQ